jgi:hypothetical protein
MSRIYFHCPAGDGPAVRGSERFHMGGLCNRLMLAAVGGLEEMGSGDPHWIRRMLPAGHYALSVPVGDPKFTSWATLGLYGGDLQMLVDGSSVQAWTIALNTAMVLGPDALRLMARLHGQCEMHCWVKGENRPWLAEIVRAGRAAEIMRPDQGWEDLAAWLASSSAAPVVCSFSVTDQFPNSDVAGVDDASWDLMDDADRWRVASDGLRPLCELRPDGFGEYRFGSGLDGFRLAAIGSRRPAAESAPLAGAAP